MVFLADLMRELAMEDGRILRELRVLTRPRLEAAMWSVLVPWCIAKSPGSVGGMAVMTKEKSSSGLGDFRDPKELVFRVQRVLGDVEGRLDSPEQCGYGVSKSGADEANALRQPRLYRNGGCWMKGAGNMDPLCLFHPMAKPCRCFDIRSLRAGEE